MVCVRKDRYLWWMSIGDCVLYLLHPKLAALGQFALNQRGFYEWVGHVNTFDLAAPCYTTGTRYLPPGPNTILLLTMACWSAASGPSRSRWPSIVSSRPTPRRGRG